MARRAREDEIPEAFGGRPRTARKGREPLLQAGYLGGQLLIAMPGMQDPRFVRSVICLCAHSADGAMGIVLNKPLDNLSFEELLRQLEVEPTPPQRQIRLMAGGPVEGGRGFVLHTADWSSEGSLKVTGELALTASVDILKAIAGGGGPRLGLLALGYAGWGPGQLEDEIQRNASLSVPADEALLFEGPPDDKWRMALAMLRVDPLLLSGSAGHA
ncbi:YqgE/AlgH family protein [Pseudoroseomonas cervicalis]|uniref:YqgE/AlgH family protein n=1 Tax=Teichococcus cervicalis TaxID=204525 RepID=UPI0035ED3201